MAQPLVCDQYLRLYLPYTLTYPSVRHVEKSPTRVTPRSHPRKRDTMLYERINNVCNMKKAKAGARIQVIITAQSVTFLHDACTICMVAWRHQFS